jgi:hypothetical protein
MSRIYGHHFATFEHQQFKAIFDANIFKLTTPQQLSSQKRVRNLPDPASCEDLLPSVQIASVASSSAARCGYKRAKGLLQIRSV